MSERKGNGGNGAYRGGSSGGNGQNGGDGVRRKELVGVVERNEVSYWTRIGAAFENRDGSWALLFDYVPTRPEVKIQMRDPLEPRARDAEPDRRQASR